ncbi:hypothetical protein RJZ56_001029 [Blastomyces dermatitidis]|uniref:Uncharacterized protein n=3 Tax=Blastomyces TaxID=229219 RepID=A0A179UP52_BLAGS|nr:uncharacterized protein BDBG_17144 [Blastomyces gilchristii SLH14081]XP_045274052.1 uncharacterized protein BDCG_01637 [Blastomyces dermatitidis ER-3]EQL37210.1 hypothetical protein BDFG_01474 [Blastomyces dermatitidis ATCC 26199]KMW66897.1 hypothetical protein BDDG_11776 [Blastomyces dermatitidis ATCC 18188]EEQ86517.1 hypothetical protein BDCG_01637 [Blastomyces dermatitidis ER-3]OAT08989.1 hypothetical protein BDBG_17144 [Blastomyces gilchristii SLH14081]
MKSKLPQNRGSSQGFVSERQPRRRRRRRNQTQNSSTHSTETSNDQHSPIDRTDSISVPDHLQMVNRHLPPHVYSVLLQRKRIVTEELNLLNQYLETLQPPHSPNQMDWEPIPPTHKYYPPQQPHPQQQSFDVSLLGLSRANKLEQTSI